MGWKVNINMEYKGNVFRFQADTKEQLLKQYKEMMPSMIECVIELMTLDEQRAVLVERLNKKCDDAVVGEGVANG